MSKDSPRILVVEDEPDVCNSLQSYFGRRGFLVSTTPSGLEALSIIETSKPDIVLLDLKLAAGSGLNGKEVLKRLRERDKETKVIVITGHFLKEEEIEEILSLGVSEYLNKPILLEKLQTMLEIILGRKISSEPAVPTAEPQASPDVSLSSIVHELSNQLGVIRNKCENFTLDIEDGISKNKSDRELLKAAVDIMNIIIATVDRAAQVVERIPRLVKKK
ncbi:MAG: response regulator [Candidatus Omnitrophota bacterium]